MAKRKVGKAKSRARKRVRRAPTARSAGAGARKAAARARKATSATRAKKARAAKAGKAATRRTGAAKPRVARKSRPATRAARTTPARSKSKVVAKPRVKAKKAVKLAAPVKEAVKAAVPVKKAVVAVPSPKNPMPAAVPRESKRKKAPDLNRERRRVQDDDAVVSPTPPSSLGLDRTASSARSGRQELRDRFDKYTETGPALTGGDIDGDWESAYSVGDEAPGGDNTTPDQNVVDDIGEAVGVNYDDNEELEGAERIEERDRHRWEFDPASSDDFDER